MSIDKHQLNANKLAVQEDILVNVVSRYCGSMDVCSDILKEAAIFGFRGLCTNMRGSLATGSVFADKFAMLNC